MIKSSKFSFMMIFLLISELVQARQLRTKVENIKWTQPTLINIKDTSVFNLIKYNDSNLLTFNDKNIINLNSRGIKLIIKDESEDQFTLSMKVRNKTILTKKHIKGISKVLIEGDLLMFSLWNYTDEDGNNKGYGYVVDLHNNLVKRFSKELSNTCNPVFLNNNFYFLNGLTLIKTDSDFNITNNLKIVYLRKNKNKFEYLDTYLISGLLKSDNNAVIINFSPKKSLKDKSYRGTITPSCKVILLNNRR